jgi:hypothetical protein
MSECEYCRNKDIFFARCNLCSKKWCSSHCVLINGAVFDVLDRAYYCQDCYEVIKGVKKDMGEKAQTAPISPLKELYKIYYGKDCKDILYIEVTGGIVELETIIYEKYWNTLERFTLNLYRIAFCDGKMVEISNCLNRTPYEYWFEQIPKIFQGIAVRNGHLMYSQCRTRYYREFVLALREYKDEQKENFICNRS